MRVFFLNRQERWSLRNVDFGKVLAHWYLRLIPLILTCIMWVIWELELELCPWNYEYQIIIGAEEDFCAVGVCILIHDHLYVR